MGVAKFQGSSLEGVHCIPHEGIFRMEWRHTVMEIYSNEEWNGHWKDIP